MTSRHRGPKRRLQAIFTSGCLQSAVTTTDVMSQAPSPEHSHIFHCRVALCTFSALCVYSTFGHHPHPLGYLCAKFRFCGDLTCWASPCRKITYSINQPLAQSFTQPAYWMSREPKLSLQSLSFYVHTHQLLYLWNPQHCQVQWIKCILCFILLHWHFTCAILCNKYKHFSMQEYNNSLQIRARL